MISKPSKSELSKLIAIKQRLISKNQRKAEIEQILDREGITNMHPEIIDAMAEGQFKCIQKCRYCHAITHECSDPNCKEPAISVCPEPLCQSKMVIEHQQKELETIKTLLKASHEEKLTADEKLREACRKLDEYRFLFADPEVLQASIAEGKIDINTARIYFARRKHSYALWTDDQLVELMDISHAHYSIVQEVVHAKNLKVEIRRNQIQKTRTANAVQKLNAAQATPVKHSTSKTPEWSKSPHGKAVWGHMKRTGCTKEQAEAYVNNF